MIIWSCDPGVNGAIVCFDMKNNEILHIIRFDTIYQPGKSVEKNKIDILSLKQKLKTLPKPDIIVLETPDVIGKNMRIAQALFFKTIGYIEACLIDYGQIIIANPKIWKRKLGLINKPKSESTRLARQLFTGLPIKNSDIAEAALIGYWSIYNR